MKKQYRKYKNNKKGKKSEWKQCKNYWIEIKTDTDNYIMHTSIIIYETYSCVCCIPCYIIQLNYKFHVIIYSNNKLTIILKNLFIINKILNKLKIKCNTYYKKRKYA